MLARAGLKANNNNNDMFEPGKVSITCSTGSFIVREFVVLGL